MECPNKYPGVKKEIQVAAIDRRRRADLSDSVVAEGRKEVLAMGP